MSITTKTGDNGETRLYSGETISKRSVRISVCGEVDELVSLLGVAKCYCNPQEIELMEYPVSLHFIENTLEEIQKKLFIVASEIATLPPKLYDLPERITRKSLKRIDKARKTLEKQIKLPKGFIVPGSTKLSAYLDLARAVCRRCEREIVKLYAEGFIDNKEVLIWMNRLSDYLYLLARYSEENNYTLLKEKKK